jgi:ankyrin repeat protein
MSPQTRLQASSKASQQAIDLISEMHGSPDFSTYSLLSSPPPFDLREQFGLYDSLDFTGDSAQSSNDFFRCPRPTPHAGDDEHSCVFGERLNEQALEDRACDFTYQLPDSLSTIDELSNPDESVLDFAIEDWLDFEDNEQTNPQDETKADSICLDKKRNTNTTSFIFTSSPSISMEATPDDGEFISLLLPFLSLELRLMIFIGTTPQDHLEQSSLNKRRGEDPPDTRRATRLRLGRNDFNSDPVTFGRRLLSLAVERWDEVSLRMLLTRDDINPNLKSGCGPPALVAAADIGNEVAVRLLLSRHDINPNSKDDKGCTALFCAARKGYNRVVRILLERKDIDPNASEDVDGRSPLMIAVWHGFDEVVRLLLERDDVDPNLRDSQGTPLWRAVLFGRMAVAKLLLERDGVDVDPINERGETLLWLSAQRGNNAILQLILQRVGVDPNQPNDGGITPLMAAARLGHEAVVRLLLADVRVRTDILGGPSGWSALTFAAHNGHEASVQLLLERDTVDTGKALLFAAVNGHEAVVRLLRKQEGVSVEFREQALRSALRRDHETDQSSLVRFPGALIPIILYG